MCEGSVEFCVMVMLLLCIVVLVINFFIGWEDWIIIVFVFLSFWVLILDGVVLFLCGFRSEGIDVRVLFLCIFIVGVFCCFFLSFVVFVRVFIWRWKKKMYFFVNIIIIVLK